MDEERYTAMVFAVRAIWMANLSTMMLVSQTRDMISGVRAIVPVNMTGTLESGRRLPVFIFEK